jgi:hypothetical protein
LPKSVAAFIHSKQQATIKREAING